MSAFPGERRIPRAAALPLLTLGALALVGCGILPKPPSGLIPHLGSKPAPVSAPQAGIGVNTYLWRATLDTLAFMPLASADPFGGTVITDWYVNPEKADERFKATVYILDTRLRADGLNVTVFKQSKNDKGEWVDAPVAAQTDIDIENAILTRARQLRLSNLPDRG
jgi:hypothetical protein